MPLNLSLAISTDILYYSFTNMDFHTSMNCPNPAIGKQDVLKVLFIMAHVNRITIIAIVASIFTIITGFYHIMMVPANNFNATILFLV